MWKSVVALLGAIGGAALATGLGCGNAGPTPSSPPCDQACKDAVAIRAFRETLKQVFNGALQMMPVGAQDQMYICMPFGGTAHVTGTVTSNASVGTTSVALTYVLDHCHYIAVDTDPTQNYDMTLTGTALENGIIAVQPGTATALSITSDAMTFSGTVYSPPIPYPGDAGGEVPASDAGPAEACSVQLAQNGNQISGKICDRTAGLTL
jgi:hypothetical protein